MNAIFWLVRNRHVARTGLSVFIILVSVATRVVAQGIATQPQPQSLPTCKEINQSVTLDLSTTSSLAIDPQWTVSGVSASSSPSSNPTGPAYHLTLAQASTIPGWQKLANWVQPFPPPPDASAAAGYYTYQIQFNIPCPIDSYNSLGVTGQYWADNLVTTFFVNGSSVSGAPLCSSNCYSAPTNFTIPSGSLNSGANTITVVVRNLGSYTGLAVKATLSAKCGDTCRATGRLKVCKVAGPGIPVGTLFIFNASDPNGSASGVVPAGPAPGGTCVLSRAIAVGTTATVTETIPAGDTVSSITVAPPGQLVNMNLTTGTVNVTMGNGVTEVTYTDQRTGYLDICKKGTEDTKGNFTFNVNPGNLGPFSVPVGYCSPAIQVAAGTVVISETSTPGMIIAGCTTVPPTQQGACNVPPQTSTVTVVPGDISTETIAIITNGPGRAGPSPAPPAEGLTLP
jgi:hypothetical protein